MSKFVSDSSAGMSCAEFVACVKATKVDLEDDFIGAQFWEVCGYPKDDDGDDMDPDDNPEALSHHNRACMPQPRVPTCPRTHALADPPAHPPTLTHPPIPPTYPPTPRTPPCISACGKRQHAHTDMHAVACTHAHSTQNKRWALQPTYKHCCSRRLLGFREGENEPS